MRTGSVVLGDLRCHVAAVRLDLGGDPRHHLQCRRREPRAAHHEEPEETVAARPGEVDRDRPALLERDPLPLCVLAPERLDERATLHLSGRRERAQLPLERANAPRGVDGEPDAGEGDGEAEQGDLASGHVGLTALRERAGYCPPPGTGKSMAKPYDPKDFYYRQAKAKGLRARSAFKIEEILERHRLLRKGDAVLDLGAAPGGFLQILAESVGETGVAVGVDLEPIRNLGKRWVKTAIVDLLAPDALAQIRALHPGRFDLVTSDMAPKTIGVKITDEARSLELCRMALGVAEQTLRSGGAFITKVFMGGEFPAFKKELQSRFDSIHVVRPQATRESSYEVYVLGKGFRPSAIR